MALKPNGAVCSIREQIIEDPISGLTLQFICRPDSDAPFRLLIHGNLPHGNREILFDANGAEAGAGTVFGDICRPSWIKEVKA